MLPPGCLGCADDAGEERAHRLGLLLRLPAVGLLLSLPLREVGHAWVRALRRRQAEGAGDEAADRRAGLLLLPLPLPIHGPATGVRSDHVEAGRGRAAERAVEARHRTEDVEVGHGQASHALGGRLAVQKATGRLPAGKT